MNFSERYGYTKARDVIQLESTDNALKNSLWTVLVEHVWANAHYRGGAGYGDGGTFISRDSNPELYVLCRALWISYFKRPLDTLGRNWDPVHAGLRDDFFLGSCVDVYNFVEFVAN